MRMLIRKLIQHSHHLPPSSSKESGLPKSAQSLCRSLGHLELFPLLHQILYSSIGHVNKLHHTYGSSEDTLGARSRTESSGRSSYIRGSLLRTPRSANISSSRSNPLVAASRELGPSSECWLWVVNTCKASVALNAELSTL